MDISLTGRGYLGWPGPAPLVGGARGAVDTSKFSEVLQDLREQAVAEKQQTVPTGSSRPRLTEAQRKYLSATYHTTQMAYAEYTALVRDLYDFGIVTEDELYTMNFSLSELGLSDEPLGLIRVTDEDCGYRFKFSSSPSHIPFNFKLSGGNLLEWMKDQTNWLRANTITGELYRDKRNLLYDRLYGVLQQIS